MPIPPDRPAVANDLGEHCQLIIGDVGYNLSGGSRFSVRSQKAMNDRAVFISPSDHLSMRDEDYWSRFTIADFRRGQGQAVYSVDDEISKSRFLRSFLLDVHELGVAQPLKKINPTGNIGNPVPIGNVGVLHVAGQYLYRTNGALVEFSPDWKTGVPSSSAASGPVIELEDDGQFLYEVVTGFGIQRVAIGSTGAAAQWTGPLAIPTGLTLVDGATSGALLSATTYSYRVSATNGLGETLASAAVTILTGGGPNTHRITLTWTPVPGATGYRVYGRSAGVEQFMASVLGGTQFIDSGSIIPNGPLPTGTFINPLNLKRIKWTNRLVFGVDDTTLYSWNPNITAPVSPLALFTLPTGWTMQDLAPKRGGAIDSPVIVMASSGSRTMLWEWDGTTIHDYLVLPTGFIGCRIRFYLGSLFISGYRLNPKFTGALGANSNDPTLVASACAYYVQNDQLGFLGYLGHPPGVGLLEAGNPTQWSYQTPRDYQIDGYDNFVYFGFAQGFNYLGVENQVWRYDIVNGGLTAIARVIPAAVPSAGAEINGMVIFRGAPAIQCQNVNLTMGQDQFGNSLLGIVDDIAELVTSNISLGQPWGQTLWTVVDISHSPLVSGEGIQVEYSINNDVTNSGTWVMAGISETPGSSGKRFIISDDQTCVQSTYIALRFRFRGQVDANGSSTAPALHTATVKGGPLDPLGLLMDAIVSCPDKMVMSNGEQDWQGLSGSERIFNIVNLYEQQCPINLTYIAPSNQRAKNPRTVVVKISEYEIVSPSSIGSTPETWLEGDVRVQFREVL